MVEKLGTSIKSSHDSYELISEKLAKNQWELDEAQIKRFEEIAGQIKKLNP